MTKNLDELVDEVMLDYNGKGETFQNAVIRLLWLIAKLLAKSIKIVL